MATWVSHLIVAEKGKFFGIVITEEEYSAFLENVSAKAAERITEYLNIFCHHSPALTYTTNR